MWAAAAAELTWTVQLAPEAQAPTTVPDSLTMSRYQGVGPTSRAALATSVTAAPGAAEVALAASPVRQTPSVEQPPPPAAGVLVGGSGVLVGPLGVLVAGTRVLVGVAVGGSRVLVGGTGVLVAVLLGVKVGALAGWVGVLVGVAVDVLVGGTGVLVGIAVCVLVGGTGVLVGGTGVLVAVLGGADKDQVTATELVLGPPPVMPRLLVLSQAV